MLTRLMKYELKATCRVIPILWIVVLLLAMLFGSLIIVTGSYALPFIMLLLVLIGMIFAVTAAMAVRFYKSMVTKEGYLTHMLPVKPWELLTAKLLTAVFWILMTTAVYIGVVLLAGAMLPTFNLSELLAANGFSDLNWPLMLLIQIPGTVRRIFQLYTAILIGGCSDNHKLICSILSWAGISILVNLLLSFWGVNTAGSAVSYAVGDAVVRITYTAASLKSVLAEVILGACFFCWARSLLAGQVNLT